MTRQVRPHGLVEFFNQERALFRAEGGGMVEFIQDFTGGGQGGQTPLGALLWGIRWEGG